MEMAGNDMSRRTWIAYLTGSVVCCRVLSEVPSSIESMFDLRELAALDSHADEASLIEQIAELERV